MKVLVRFCGDNDFCTVMRAFGELLARRGEWTAAMTKTNIVRWFNSVAFTLYQMVQAHDVPGDSDETLRTYLVIEEKDVFVGEEEVRNKMASWQQWGNGDSVLVDFSPHCAPNSVVTIV